MVSALAVKVPGCGRSSMVTGNGLDHLRQRSERRVGAARWRHPVRQEPHRRLAVLRVGRLPGLRDG